MRTSLARIPAGISLLALVMLSSGTVSASSLAAVSPNIPTGHTYIVTGYTSGAYLWHSNPYMITTFGPHAEIKPQDHRSGTQEYIDEDNSALCLTYVPGPTKITEANCTASTKQLWKSTKLSNGAWKITNVYDGSSHCMTEADTVGDDVEMKSCGQSRQDWIWNEIIAHKRGRPAAPHSQFISGASQHGERPER